MGLDIGPISFTFRVRTTADNVWDLIEGCWAVDVAERMTIAKVIEILEGEVNARQ